MNKKVITSVYALLASTVVFAQDSIDVERMQELNNFREREHEFEVIKSQAEINLDVFYTCALIFGITLFFLFVLNMIKKFLDQKIKNKIIDNNITESMAQTLLNHNVEEEQNSTLRWFSILTGIALGTSLLGTIQNINPAPILALCLAVSLLVYYFYLKRKKQ
jgi:ABC-type uncharacterized transport system fused permease/ATPase subunit